MLNVYETTLLSLLFYAWINAPRTTFRGTGDLSGNINLEKNADVA